MTTQEIIAKIKKCLALSKSDNEHEAATAMRQAVAMMAKHNIEDAELLAADASESATKAGARVKPSAWETGLAYLVGDAFGCCTILGSPGVGYGEWRYIGTGASPEIAAYAFQVLFRQARGARAEYMQTALKRCKPANKTVRADVFCDAWVSGIGRLLQAFAKTEQQSAAIAAYVSQRYPKLQTIETINRGEGKNSAALDAAHWAGRNAAKGVRLDRGVGGAPGCPALEG